MNLGSSPIHCQVRNLQIAVTDSWKLAHCVWLALLLMLQQGENIILCYLCARRRHPFCPGLVNYLCWLPSFTIGSTFHSFSFCTLYHATTSQSDTFLLKKMESDLLSHFELQRTSLNCSLYHNLKNCYFRFIVASKISIAFWRPPVPFCSRLR